MKVVVISLLIASSLAASLTPNTKLPQAFDDMVANELSALSQEPKEIIEKHMAKVKVSTSFSQNELNHGIGFIKANIPWVPDSQLEGLRKRLEFGMGINQQIDYDLTDNRLRYYNIIVTRDELGKYRFILVWNEVEGGLGSSKLPIMKYTAISKSVFGLPGKDRVIRQKNMDPRLLDLVKRHCFTAIQRARGTPKMFAHSIASLGAEGDEPAQKEEKKEEGGIMSILGGAKNVIQQLADGYKSIVSAFKTIKKEELKEKISGEGFNEYTAKSRYLRSIGIPKSYWETYKKSYMELTGIAKNPRVKPDIETLLKMADFIQDNAWNNNDLTFDASKGGTCSNFVCLTRFDAVIQKYHIMTTVVDGTFQLAPNIWIYTSYKSVAGGIVETTKYKTKYMPRSLTEGDAKSINAMMLLTSINIMQENFGMPKTLPEFAEMTQDVIKRKL